MKRPDVTDAELAILEELWRSAEPQPISALVEALYPQRNAAAHATVQSLLGRLEVKACVTRRRSGRAHLYSATVGRDDVIGHRLQSLAERLCEGSLTPLLTHLVQGASMTAADREALRRLLADVEGSTANPRRKS